MYIKIENIDGTSREGDISEEAVIKIFELIFGAIPTDETADNENEQKN